MNMCTFVSCFRKTSKKINSSNIRRVGKVNDKKTISFPNHIERKEEQQILIDIYKLNSSNIRLTNYKLVFNALLTTLNFVIYMIKTVLCVKEVK